MGSDNKRTAMVTGAGTGIGRAIAIELGKAGYDVCVHYHGSPADAEAVADDIRAFGNRAEVISADLCDVANIRTLFADVSERFDQLDLFVNNAGVTLLAPFLEMDEETFDKLYKLNFRGAYFAMQSAARIMAARGGGHLVAIASNNAFTQFARAAAYGSMKTGLVKMCRHIGLEMAKHGVRCNAIAPGWTDTGAARLDDKASTYYKIPLKRWVLPAEIGKTVVFLDSDAAASITGACLVMDGGAQLLSDKAEKYGL